MANSRKFTAPSEHLYTENFYYQKSKSKNGKNGNQKVNFLTSPNEDVSERNSIEKNQFFVPTKENDIFQYFEFKSFGQLAQASKTGGFYHRRSLHQDSSKTQSKNIHESSLNLNNSAIFTGNLTPMKMRIENDSSTSIIDDLLQDSQSQQPTPLNNNISKLMLMTQNPKNKHKNQINLESSTLSEVLSAFRRSQDSNLSKKHPFANIALISP